MTAERDTPRGPTATELHRRAEQEHERQYRTSAVYRLRHHAAEPPRTVYDLPIAAWAMGDVDDSDGAA